MLIYSGHSKAICEMLKTQNTLNEQKVGRSWIVDYDTCVYLRAQD